MGKRNCFKPLLDRDWLQEQYVTNDRSSADIAKEIGCNRKTVDNALHRHGIPVRNRGSHKNCRRIRKGDPNGMKGRKHTQEAKRLIGKRLAAAWAAKNSGLRPMHDTKKGRRHGPDHPNWKGGVSPERAVFYSTEEWKTAARFVWKRDKGTCQRCGLVKVASDGVMFDIHHIVSFAYKPLRCEPTNLILFCEPCHYWAHGNENTERLYIKEAPGNPSEGDNK
jgi:hypothetical protein